MYPIGIKAALRFFRSANRPQVTIGLTAWSQLVAKSLILGACGMSSSNAFACQEASRSDGLTLEESRERTELVWKETVSSMKEALEKELDANEIELNGKKLKLLVKQFGEAPEGSRSLYISMHGGGGAPSRVNDQQWKNQIRLYEPEEGFYVAPRAPSDNWNLWHEAHIDGLFDRLILAHIICRGVDPNRVYLMGYSAGGDGVFQLAPRMSDRWAAVAMMAGHPNETRPDGLRNVPFALFMGEKDSAFKRNEVAKEWKSKLGALAASDEGGYDHWVKTYDTGHWMNGQDRECLPWLSQRKRNAWPKKLVWLQDDVKQTRSYWLGVDIDKIDERTEIKAHVNGQTVSIDSVSSDKLQTIRLYLSDSLLDLDAPISVVWQGKKVFDGKVLRTADSISRSLSERLDFVLAAPVLLEIQRP